MNQDSQAGPGRDIHASRGPLPAIFQRNLAILAPWSAPARRRFIRASLPPRSTRISPNHLLPLSRRVCAVWSHLAFAPRARTFHQQRLPARTDFPRAWVRFGPLKTPDFTLFHAISRITFADVFTPHSRSREIHISRVLRITQGQSMTSITTCPNFLKRPALEAAPPLTHGVA